MKTKAKNKDFVQWAFFFLFVFCLFVLSEGSGGGGRGGGRGSRSSGRNSGKIVLAAAAGGAAGYIVSKHHQNQDPHRFHSNPLDNPAFNSGGGARVGGFEEDYKLQESSYYNRGEGFGMSALGLILIILGIIGGLTMVWYCLEVCYPLYRARKARNRQSNYTTKEGHPLQETPSTATPSP